MIRSLFSFVIVFHTGVVIGQNNNIPSSIRVPSNSRLLWHAYAKGVQIYVGTQDPNDSTHFIWTFKEPRADLYADSSCRQRIGKHYLDADKNPAWETGDGSKVSGIKVQANAPDSMAIPWLLLQAKAGTGKGTLQPTVFIQRVHTDGGKAPAASSQQNKGQLLEVPYTAEYLFYGEN
jgi:hypothetical protein